MTEIQKTQKKLASCDQLNLNSWPALTDTSKILSDLVKENPKQDLRPPDGLSKTNKTFILIQTIQGPAYFLKHTGLSSLRANAGQFPLKVVNPNQPPPKPPENQPPRSYAQVVCSSPAKQGDDQAVPRIANMADRKFTNSGEQYGRDLREGFNSGYAGRRPYRSRGMTRQYVPRNNLAGQGRGQWSLEHQRSTAQSRPDHSIHNENRGFQQGQSNSQQGHNAESETLANKKRTAEVDKDHNEPKQKKSTGEFCFRCFQPDHDKSVCTTELLCDICEAKTHLTAKCPHIKGPKLTATPVGFAVEGLGYHHIPYTPIAEPKKPSKTALVSVEGGHMEASQVIEQLRRLMPGKWNWSAEPTGDNTFLVPFPSKAELTRALAFGSADLKALGKKLVFEEYHEKTEGEIMPLAWLKIFDLPKNLRVKPVLWGIGSMLGATMKVDMKSTLKNDYGRVQVAVLDPKLIPNQLSVAVGRRWYAARIEIESVDAGSEDTQMEEDDLEDDNMDYQDNVTQDNTGPDNNQHQESTGNNGNNNERNSGQKNQRNDGGGHSQNEKTTHMAIDWTKVNTAGWSVEGLNALEREEFYKLKAKEIIDYAVDKEIQKCASMVAAEEDLPREEVMVEDAVTETDEDNEVQATRSSARLKNSSTQDSLEKASSLKAKKNLEENGGDFQSHILDQGMVQATERGQSSVPRECLSEA